MSNQKHQSYPRSIAPSQLRKMVKISSITSQVIPCTARVDMVAAGMNVVAGEKFFLVQSDRFPGYAYVVTFNNATAKYVCSCGNPVCTAHVNPVVLKVNTKFAAAPAPVVAKPVEITVDVVVEVVNEELDKHGLCSMSIDELRAFHKAAYARQREADREYMREYRRKVAEIKAAQAVA
jgi:hypothetical protein